MYCTVLYCTVLYKCVRLLPLVVGALLVSLALVLLTIAGVAVVRWALIGRYNVCWALIGRHYVCWAVIGGYNAYSPLIGQEAGVLPQRPVPVLAAGAGAEAGPQPRHHPQDWLRWYMEKYVIELQMIPRFSQSWRRPLLLVNDAQFCLRSLSARQHFAQLTRENSFVLVNNYTRERRSIEHLSCFAGLVITNCRGCAANILLQSLVFTLSVIAFWWENGDQVYW